MKRKISLLCIQNSLFCLNSYKKWIVIEQYIPVVIITVFDQKEITKLILQRITAIHFNIMPLKLGETSGTFIPNRSPFDIPTFTYILSCAIVGVRVSVRVNARLETCIRYVILQVSLSYKKVNERTNNNSKKVGIYLYYTEVCLFKTGLIAIFCNFKLRIVNTYI